MMYRPPIWCIENLTQGLSQVNVLVLLPFFLLLVVSVDVMEPKNWGDQHGVVLAVRAHIHAFWST